jgi:hypothetical protein
VIGTSNNAWPLSTPQRGGTPITPTSYLGHLWRSSLQSRVTGIPLPDPGLGRDGKPLDVIDESDEESDWVTDDEYPDSRPSHGGGPHPDDFLDLRLYVWHCTRCAWPVLENRKDWMDEVEWCHPEVIWDCNMSTMPHNLSNSQDLLEWVLNQPPFAPDNLADALWGSLAVIGTLSTHGLLDHAFELCDVPGAFQSQCLLVLWRVLG